MDSPPSLPPPEPQDKQKKPRHRHSPAQLAALNELYDRDEHPALDLRTSLAKRLGMEIKTVNAWFQNKRASSKKRTRSAPSAQEPSPISAHINTARPQYSSPAPRQTAFEEYPEEDSYLPLDRHNPITPPEHSRSLSSFYAGNPDHTHFLSENDSIPRKLRMRPTPEQTEELRKLYNENPHPTTEQRQILADRIGMRYQSITNWFQNQRSLAKKRKEDEAEGTPDSVSAASLPSREARHEGRTFSAFPPPSTHPSLLLPPTSHPSLAGPSRISRRSPSVTPSVGDEPYPFRRSKRSVTPYSGVSSLSRPRRTRPEPYQLHALKELFTKTANPSIEERNALALEIGMDVGKVTNWFRNLRQTARKRAKKMGSGEDDDDESYMGHQPRSASVSRSGTPSLHSSSSSNEYADIDNSMDLDQDNDPEPRSRRGSGASEDDAGSDEDYQQEAVTPPPEPSPSPDPQPYPATAPSADSSSRHLPPLPLGPPPHSRRDVHVDVGMMMDRHLHRPYVDLDKATATRYSGIRIEDALLLLSFHQHVVH